MFKHQLYQLVKYAAGVVVGVLLTGEVFGDTPATFTLGGVDRLGRSLPIVRHRNWSKNRFVAIFYWPWHYSAAHETPYNNSEIIAKFPAAKNDPNHPVWADKPFESSHFFWGKPLFGYYTNLDRWVLAKHAVMLADAGVDVIVFDATNGTETWMPAVEEICLVFQELLYQGIPVPKIAFMLNFAPNENTKNELHQLYNDFYSRGRYRELWFMWQNKPLIMAHPEALSAKDKADAEILKFFTFRRNEPGYFTKNTLSGEQRWGWCSTYPQTHFGYVSNWLANIEEMTVSPAQNATAHRLCAMNDPRGGVFGRGFAKGDYEAQFSMWNGKNMKIKASTPEAWQWGLNFQQQFDYAVAKDPSLLFVTGWNEWIAARYKEWQATPNAFPDEFLPEFSRDIEPAEDAPYDNFYFQLIYNIRRYKGNASLPPPVTKASNRPYDGFQGWQSVQPLFTDPRDCWARNSYGWKGYRYFSITPPNDMIAAKACYDDENLYFYLRCDKPMVPNTNLRLLLATGGAGWEGFDYVVQRATGGGFSLLKFENSKQIILKKVTDVPSNMIGNEFTLSVPIKALGLKPDFKTQIQFKWSDEQNLEKSALSFYTEGDCAPNGRFRYILIPDRR